MKILLFDDFKLGVLKGDLVVDVSDVVSDIVRTGPHDLINGLIERFDEYRPKLEAAVASGTGVPVTSARIRPPLPRPVNIDCMSSNYMEESFGRKKTDLPVINAFHKSPGAIIGPGDTMIFPDIPAHLFEGEAELGVVIGKRASNIREEDAMSHVFGYINFIDGSARGLPPPVEYYFQMKSRETFAPIGPFIVTADEIPDPHALQVRLWVNGRLNHDFNTSEMAHKIPKSIAWLSSIHTLHPGDIVATGTNHGGLSCFQDGDTIEMETEGLGRLEVTCRDDLKRTWGRETRGERKKQGLTGACPQLTGKYAVSDA